MTVEIVSPIIILGMHRSGTSCLAGTLEKAGVKLGEVSNRNKFNLKGNKENSLIMSLNDDILKYNKASWDSPPIDITWNKSHILRAKDITKYFETTYPINLWGFKDPRTLLTFDFWDTIFPSATLIGSLRAPEGVVASLKNRDPKFDHSKGLSLWLQYNTILLKLLNEKNFPLISFDSSSKEYLHDTTKLLHLLFPNKLEFKSNTFFDEELRSNTNKDNIKIPIEIKDCHQKLLNFLNHETNLIT